MVGSSKILTVSYGTFSCTLEGFDDSFSTMKAIAEYFRDLAADDRYFGAEPPTPDADMLARIAEREISRRVEARTDDSGIVLRAASALAAPDAASDEPADFVAPAAAETAIPMEESAPDVVVPEATAPDAPAMPPAATPPQEADVAAQVAQVAQAEATVADSIAKDAPLAPSPSAFDDAPAAPVSIAQAPSAQPAAAPVHPDADSVAAKLQRIRAVVGKAAAPIEQASFVEDQHAPSLADAADDLTVQDVFEADIDLSDEQDLNDEPAQVEPLADAADIAVEVSDEPVEDDPDLEIDTVAEAAEDAVIEAAEISEDLTDDAQDIAEVEVAADQVSDDLDETANVPADKNVEAEAEAEDTTDEMLSNIAAKSTKPTVRARIVRLRKDPAAAQDQAAPADDDLVASVLGADTPADDAAPALQDDQSQDDIEAPELETVAETLADLAQDEEASADDVSADEAISDEVLSDDVDATDVEPIASPSIAALDGADELLGSDDAGDHTQSDLSPEDEADLQEELAEVEREMADTPVTPQRPGRSILPETDDAAMSRIMSQTDEALSEPEGSRRRNAIAQLKAAVAATEAARQLGDKSTEKAKTEDAFREDLDQAVRPQRPTRPTRPEKSDEARTARPRPAPLKLVASQRIDAPAADQPAAPDTPVQPRRVALSSEAVSQSDATSFAEFAEEMGAKELPDLLEAAAAYTAFVEGVEDFSRPQIMKKVQLTSDEAFSREDGLRSFGTLLRQGRISKVRNGRFQVSEQTRFRPEQRAG